MLAHDFRNAESRLWSNCGGAAPSAPFPPGFVWALRVSIKRTCALLYSRRDFTRCREDVQSLTKSLLILLSRGIIMCAIHLSHPSPNCLFLKDSEMFRSILVLLMPGAPSRRSTSEVAVCGTFWSHCTLFWLVSWQYRSPVN